MILGQKQGREPSGGKERRTSNNKDPHSTSFSGRSIDHDSFLIAQALQPRAWQTRTQTCTSCLSIGAETPGVWPDFYASGELQTLIHRMSDKRAQGYHEILAPPPKKVFVPKM
jgi:hypothetical protein